MSIRGNEKVIKFLFTPLLDMAHKKMLLFTFIPLLIAIIIWTLFITIAFNHFHVFASQFPNFWIEYSNGDGAFSTLSYWLLIIATTITVFVYGVIISGVFMVLVGSFISPVVVRFVHSRYFPHVHINPERFWYALRISLCLFIKTLCKFIIFGIIFYFFWFIGLGLISVIAHIILFFRFFSVNINNEIVLNIMTKQEYDIFLEQNRVLLTGINIIIFLPSYIPIIGNFIVVWQMGVLSHFMLDWYGRIGINNNDYVDVELIET